MILPIARENGEPVTEEYVKALNAHGRIIAAKAATEQSLYELCAGLKDVHDNKYYKTLGYSSFEEYTQTEHGITRRQGERMIKAVDTYEDLKNAKLTSHFGSTEKFYILSTLSESDRTEIVETTDLESTTVRELKGKIKTLTEQAEEACERADKLKKSENKAWGEVSRFKTDSEMKSEKITQLEAEIKELESRPVEVAVSHEEENLRKAMQKIDLDWGIKYGELEEESNNERMKLLREHDAEIAALKEDYEKKLSERPAAETVTDDKETFKAYLAAAADAVKRLCAFITAHNDSPNAALYRSKAADLAKMITTVMED